MGFPFTIALLVLIPALLSAAISVPIFRLKKSYAKPLAIVLGIFLFLVFLQAGFVLLIDISARAGQSRFGVVNQTTTLSMCCCREPSVA